MLSWNIYEIHSLAHTLHGVKLRGRIRKFALGHQITCLVENALDAENLVRFALLPSEDLGPLMAFVQTIIPDAEIFQVLASVPNPVLSKLKVNDVSRYA